jgi:hypothetical protein
MRSAGQRLPSIRRFSETFAAFPQPRSLRPTPAWPIQRADISDEEPRMDQYLETAYAVTSSLFGPGSGIPWWAWTAVVVLFFWKVAVKEPKSARQEADERADLMLGQMLGDAKGKK